MRLAVTLLIGAGLCALTGCSGLISLNSFAPDGLLVQNPLLPGVWSDSDSIVIIKAMDRGYTITMVPRDKNDGTLTFNAQLFGAGNAEILDLVPADDKDPFRIAVHTPVRIRVDEHTLKFSYLDSKWLRARAREQLAAQDTGDRVLITAPGDAVTKFLLLNGGDDRAYEGTPSLLER